MGQVIDGKSIAKRIREDIIQEILLLKREKSINPKLAVILVGENPASESYVKGKEKACTEVGIESPLYRFSSEIKQEELLALIEKLNADPTVHGILLQLPLPKGLDEIKSLEAISPEKDVDGLHPYNMGKLFKGEVPLFVPCTPQGIMDLVLSTGVEIKGKKAVVVGRSNLVGKPVGMLLLFSHATLTFCHTRTKDLKGEIKSADILIAAAGKPKMITKDMIKPGAIVIDVGINRTEKGLCGDVDFEQVKEIASYITPVPGGVGPMTVAMLLKNTLTAAKRMAEGEGPAPKIRSLIFP
ncbi:MAG: bifunctional methylenetetrahydrofolate dehydrogenase/methenyltetrahydrofolate cyclohydrolase FolD [Candidatus Saganbacteria bacterium]|nr:bifunctional methylenetetrahydrofolate dehydrogenase/methenyltetrahydrofolate cyclohydrolase FolD [Candidatus Saganbacteria bacterium]